MHESNERYKLTRLVGINYSFLFLKKKKKKLSKKVNLNYKDKAGNPTEQIEFHFYPPAFGT